MVVSLLCIENILVLVPPFDEGTLKILIISSFLVHFIHLVAKGIEFFNESLFFKVQGFLVKLKHS